ncbi:unnamed protein product [Rotaria sordida]|uniref:Uncharacterized protein n=1 Tax=Rotaria sordida TaxID=392033 RepID=A0A820DSZ9_9BILA|nr:unnamed protein product [Rotaria sordida]
MIQQLLDNSLTILTTSQIIKKFTLNYALPRFNKAFEEDAEAASPLGFITRCRQQQQLVETIHNDVVHNSRIDFYSTAFKFG